MKYLCSLCIWIMCIDVCFAEKSLAVEAGETSNSLVRTDFLAPHDMHELILTSRASVQGVFDYSLGLLRELDNKPSKTFVHKSVRNAKPFKLVDVSSQHQKDYLKIKTLYLSANTRKTNKISTQEIVKNDYIDPYDIGNESEINPSDSYVDPYDVPVMNGSEGKPKKPVRKKIKKEVKSEVKKAPMSNSGPLTSTDNLWKSWKSTHIQEPKPPLDWPQVGLEVGVGYVGAFGGSVIGLFSGFLVGSIYDGVSKCEQCWVNIAISMSTVGVTLGATSSVYLMGNNDEQLSSALATYTSTVIPVLIGAITYRNSKQLNKSGFYLVTMPLFAVAGYNISRYYRKKGEKALFENFFVDDVWVSKERDNVLAANIRLRF